MGGCLFLGIHSQCGSSLRLDTEAASGEGASPGSKYRHASRVVWSDALRAKGPGSNFWKRRGEPSLCPGDQRAAASQGPEWSAVATLLRRSLEGQWGTPPSLCQLASVKCNHRAVAPCAGEEEAPSFGDFVSFCPHADLLFHRPLSLLFIFCLIVFHIGKNTLNKGRKQPC